jgi:hypothetical protein
MGSQLRQSPITESSGHRRADPLGVEVHIQRRPLVVGFTQETGIRRSGHADSIAPMWYGRTENAVRRGCRRSRDSKFAEADSVDPRGHILDTMEAQNS